MCSLYMLCRKKTNILRGGKDAHICRTDSAQPLSVVTSPKSHGNRVQGNLTARVLCSCRIRPLHGRINIWLTGPPTVRVNMRFRFCGIQKSCEFRSKRSWSVIDVTAAVRLHDFARKSCRSPTLPFNKAPLVFSVNRTNNTFMNILVHLSLTN